jgi:hypothetical protein
LNFTERDGFVLLPWNAGSPQLGRAARVLTAASRVARRAKPVGAARFTVILLGLSFFGGGCLGCAFGLLAQA